MDVYNNGDFDDAHNCDAFYFTLHLKALISWFAAEYGDAPSRPTYEYCFFASQD